MHLGPASVFVKQVQTIEGMFEVSEILNEMGQRATEINACNSH